MNHLLLWKDMILFLGSNSRKLSKHKHPVIQLVVSKRKKFRLEDASKSCVARGFLIASNHPHKGYVKNLQILSVGINPRSDLGNWINKNYLATDKIIQFPSSKAFQIDFDTFRTFINNERFENIRSSIKKSFNYEPSVSPTELDERIQQTLNYISKNINCKISTEALMNVTHLSESRLLHLFKVQLGLPIRNYILWHRLQLALQDAFDGASLSQAAYKYGFADQSHLTRTCVRLIGIPPSILTKNSNFIQVFNQP